MTGIADKTAFQMVMSQHFQIADQKTEFWQGLFYAFIPLPKDCTIIFRGWAGFERRMPRYARRLQDMLTAYSKVVMSETLLIEYI